MRLNRVVFVMKRLWTCSGIVAVLFGVLTQGCGRIETFARPDAYTFGVYGKSWVESGYLEFNPQYPSVDSGNRSYLGFQVRGSGTTAMMGATLYDSVGGKFLGYARRYDSGLGWAKPGMNFSVIARQAGEHLGFVNITAGPAGLWFAGFKGGPEASETLHLKLFNGTWTTGTQDTPVPGGPSPIPTSSSYEVGAPLSSTFDSTGRVYVADFETGTPFVHNVRLRRWVPGNPVSTYTGDSYSFGGNDTSIEAIYDGVDSVCVFSSGKTGLLVSVSKLSLQCFNVAGPGTWGASPQSISVSLASRGASVATDSNGRVIALWMETISGTNYLKYAVVNQGTVASSLVLTSDMGGSWEVSAFPRAYSIVYLGGGKFLAAWVGDSGSEDAIFSKIYDSDTNSWSVSQQVTDSYPYTVVPHLRALELFSNEEGNVVLASLYDLDESQIYQAVVSRFQIHLGWQQFFVFGNGCDAKTGEVSRSNCLQRPQGAVLSNGDALVVWGDQDQSGRNRIAGVEFR